MSRSLSLLLALLFSVAIPAILLHASAGDSRLEAGLTAPLFAWPRLLFAHLVAALPLSVAIVSRLANAWGFKTRRIAGLLLVLIFWGMLQPLAETLNDLESGFTIRTLLRTLFAVATVSGCLLLTTRQLPPVSLGTTMATLALASLPPGAYTARLIEARGTDFETFSKSRRLVKAETCLQGLCDLGSTREYGKRTVYALLPLLRKEIDKLERLTGTPLAETAPLDAKTQRVFQLVELNRLTEAEEILNQLSPGERPVELGRLVIQRERENWAELEASSRRLIESLAHDSTSDRTLLELAYENLSESLKNRQLHRELEAMLAEAEKTLPARAGSFRFQLGLHFANRGQTENALQAFAEAEQLDPKLHSVIEPQRRRLKTNTFSCLTR
jgi:tetratricopeptide (TPR) repeat protein